MGLIEALPAGPVAVDTAAFIYLIERHPTYLPAVRPLFEAADVGDKAIVTSGVTLLEVLGVPYRAGRLRLAEAYERLLTGSRGVTLISLDTSVLRSAAQIRAARDVPTPDALQMAAAFAGGCTSFVTNDRRIPELPGLPVVQLDDHV